MRQRISALLMGAALCLMPLLSIASAMTMTALAAAYMLAAFLQTDAGFWRQPREAMLRHRQAVLVLVLLFGWPLMSAMWSITPQESFTSSLSMLGLAGAATLAAQALQHSPAPSAKLAKILPITLAVAAVLVVIELLPGGGIIQAGIQLSGHEDLYFLDKTINRGLCALVMLLWPAMLMLHFTGCGRYAWVLAAVLALPVFLLHSLSAKMGLVAGVVVWILIARWPAFVSRALVVGVPVMMLAWPLGFATFETRLKESFFYTKLPISSQHRVEIWGFSLGKASEKPFAGWGMNTSRAIPGHDDRNAQGRTNLPLHPHNNVMQLLLEQGIAGLILSITAVALLLRNWQRAVTTSTDKAAMGAALLAYLTIGFTAFGLWQTWWVATGLVAFVLLSGFNVMRKSPSDGQYVG